jgi:hypothetical protein
VWLIGNKRKFAFVLFILSGIFWILVAIKSGVYGLLIVVVPAIIANIRNWFLWSQPITKGMVNLERFRLHK